MGKIQVDRDIFLIKCLIYTIKLEYKILE